MTPTVRDRALDFVDSPTDLDGLSDEAIAEALAFRARVEQLNGQVARLVAKWDALPLDADRARRRVLRKIEALERRLDVWDQEREAALVRAANEPRGV